MTTKRKPQLDLFETLGEARERFHGGLDAGTRCPCCDRFAKRYRRRLGSSMARALILIHRYFRDNPGATWLKVEAHLTADGVKPNPMRGDFHKLRWWGFLERLEGQREDGSDRVGAWRITDEGVAWALGETYAPSYAIVLFNELERLDGPMIKVWDALGARFDYQELMKPWAPTSAHTMQTAPTSAG